MSKTTFAKTTLRIDWETDEKVSAIAKQEGKSKADVFRELIELGLEKTLLEDHEDEIAKVVRQQVDIAMKPHVERLAKLNSKTGHAASTAMFLLVFTLTKLVPVELREDVRTVYELARKRALKYMAKNLSDLDIEELLKDN